MARRQQRPSTARYRSFFCGRELEHMPVEGEDAVEMLLCADGRSVRSARVDKAGRWARHK